MQMSLYDDILSSSSKKGESNDDNKSSNWSGIKLLENHLLSKKIAKQSKRDSYARRPASYGLGFGFKAKTNNEETAPLPVLDYHGKQSTGSLLGGDWDTSSEYDPLFPNDYEKVVKEKKELKEKLKAEETAREFEEMEKRRREKFDTGISLIPKSLVGAYSDDEDDVDFKSYSTSKLSLNKSREGSRIGGAAIAPPPSLIESSVKGSEDSPIIQTNIGKGSVAAKIMARMGYKEGQGLGKEEQGISRALEVEKTSKRGGKIISGQEKEFFATPPPLTSSVEINAPVSQQVDITTIMKNPTKVVLLRNMVGPGEVDDELEPEVKEECSKYGEVLKCIIYELTNGSPEEAVRIFVEFKRVESAIKAVVDLNGRYFGGRIVKGNFYDVEKFKRLELND